MAEFLPRDRLADFLVRFSGRVIEFPQNVVTTDRSVSVMVRLKARSQSCSNRTSACGNSVTRCSASDLARLRNSSLFITNRDCVGTTVCERWPAI